MSQKDDVNINRIWNYTPLQIKKYKSKECAAFGIGTMPGRCQMYPIIIAVCSTETMYMIENGEQLYMQIEDTVFKYVCSSLLYAQPV